MARPSRNTDQLLIQAARKFIPKAGITGLNLRDVAKEAGVNLGMFHYHFKTKEEFVRRILQVGYEEFFSGLAVQVSGAEPPLDRLRKALLHMGQFARDNRSLIVSLLKDVLNGDKEVIAFVKVNFGRHFSLLIQLVQECKKTQAIEDLPLPVIMSHLIGAAGLPNLIFEVLERVSARKPFGLVLSVVRKMFLGDDAIEARIELALKGLRKEKRA